MSRRFVSLCAMAAALGMPAAAQSVDEIIAKNIEAHGGEAKMRAIHAMRMTGRISFQGLEAPVVLEVKRPKNLRMELVIQGMTLVQAFDGSTGWQIVPFQGSTDPQPMSADELKDVEDQADMDGPLVDYKAKGHTVTLEGKENIEGADCFKLKVAKKNGDVQYYFVDSDSYLELKMTSKRMVRGTEQEVEVSFGDFKSVDGYMMAHTINNGIVGSPQRQTIMMDKVEVNPAIDDARFKQPVKAAPAAAKPPGY